MNNVKTYGEIQYYLYDGDKTEKNVSKDEFFKSTSVAVKHYTKPVKRETTTSLTGVVIENISSKTKLKRFKDF